MKKEKNINRKCTESGEYYVGAIKIDGVKTRVLFTEYDLKRPIERAKKQTEEFKKSNGLGIFSMIAKWFR